MTRLFGIRNVILGVQVQARRDQTTDHHGRQNATVELTDPARRCGGDLDRSEDAGPACGGEWFAAVASGFLVTCRLAARP